MVIVVPLLCMVLVVIPLALGLIVGWAILWIVRDAELRRPPVRRVPLGRPADIVFNVADAPPWSTSVPTPRCAEPRSYDAGPGVRRGRLPDQRQPDVPPPDVFGLPWPGDVWWAEVPFREGTGSKRRPCLVVRTFPDEVHVLKITSTDKSHRDDHVPIPTATWDSRALHDSWLDLSDTFELWPAMFKKRAGPCDPDTWRRVESHFETGVGHARNETR